MAGRFEQSTGLSEIDTKLSQQKEGVVASPPSPQPSHKGFWPSIET